MKRIHNFYFICEDGHLTVGDTHRREKCPYSVQRMNFEKGKKVRQFDTVKEKIVSCDKKVIETHEIHETLNFLEVWSHRDMHAFLLNQKVNADFVIELQKSITGLYKIIKERSEKS